MTTRRTMLVLTGAAASLVIAAAWPVQHEAPAQEPSGATIRVKEAPRIAEPTPSPTMIASETKPETAKVPVVVALGRPASLPFGAGTSLEGLVEELSKELGAPVVLDLAALDRLKLTPKEVVRLQLDGVRLQTGLKLMLDQVGMTYRVIPEDNLLILTDRQGSGDPADRSMEELKAIRHELAELRLIVEEIDEMLAPREVIPSTRNPTIIEEIPGPRPVPDEPGRRPTNPKADEPGSHSRPG